MRTSKALFAVTGTPEQLKEMEQLLKDKGASGTMANEGSRLLQLKWLVVYTDYNKKDATAKCEVTYAYRTTNCKHTSRPSVITLKVAQARIRDDRYFYAKEGATFLHNSWYQKLFR